ncbi:cobalt-precorrin-6A reductase [Stagnihabitans tardus]|uniref:Cobalt-precorrin-6A reductase n=1 Tax=Stagnihabitans tardus TaxID=2699202 RepID=A0AAE5BTA1_9RHOB|nr:cobalt-precorrin-6A reductase [Stagnihabitans tardus]NBZ85957.1 cobalt-precorrin-6A reductase [Stagnihabitans tardus]
MRILLLGGTTEASLMAKTIADHGIAGVFSYAGRTDSPVMQPLPQRVGGFGGVAGLVDYLRSEAITHVIDATHPFAAQMSTHAVAACSETGTPLIALERKPWRPGPGDDWLLVPRMEDAVQALPSAPARVFLAIGRLQLEVFTARPEHHYILRLVDPPRDLPFAAEVILSRGPFAYEDDLRLMQERKVQVVVSKNAGGIGARAKLDAARALGLRVILVDRPPVPPRHRVETVAEVMSWLHADLGE